MLPWVGSRTGIPWLEVGNRAWNGSPDGDCSKSERKGQAHFSELKFVSQQAPIG